MRILEWSWKNYKSYGGVMQNIKLNQDKGELILIVGKNGFGKCVEKKTNIDIHIDDLVLTNELIIYLDTTEVGVEILKYIKDTNNVLYEKINNFKINTK